MSKCARGVYVGERCAGVCECARGVQGGAQEVCKGARGVREVYKWWGVQELCDGVCMCKGYASVQGGVQGGVKGREEAFKGLCKEQAAL